MFINSNTSIEEIEYIYGHDINKKIIICYFYIDIYTHKTIYLLKSVFVCYVCEGFNRFLINLISLIIIVKYICHWHII